MTACSSQQLPEFTTEGVVAPAARCDVDPRQFAEAQSLGDHGRGACMVRDAYRITATSGVRFSEPAVVNCAAANGFDNWIRTVVQPAAQKYYGARVESVTIAASYACRARNGRPGGKLSEHGFGNAIDVSGLTLSDGRRLSVKDDYRSSAFLKQIRKEACGTFMTVLGPGSDRSHHDHFHFDLANRRSGQRYCR
jgi:hypothetical protein